MAETDACCKRCEDKLASLRSEVTGKNLELLEARNVAMSAIAQLKTRIAKQNATIATANSTIRKFQASQGENKGNSSALNSGPKALVPENVMVHRLRRRVKAALSEIRTLKNEVGVHKTAAEKSQKAEIKYKEQLDRALSKVDQLEENAIDREALIDR